MAKPRPLAQQKIVAYTLDNKGQAGVVCPKCNQPIQHGEMVNYTQSGMEAHVTCPVSQGQQNFQTRLNLPKNFKPPQQPHKPGQISPSVGRPTASQKEASYADDEFRGVLEANGYMPAPGTGFESEEIWRNPHTEIRVVIGVDEEDHEPFWAQMNESGEIGLAGNDVEALKRLVEEEHSKPSDQPEWTTTDKGEKVPQFSDSDKDFLQDFRMKGSMPIRVVAGKPVKDGFVFVVPMRSSGLVAFQLAKAGLDEFQTRNYPEDSASMFVFKTEPELQVAEEIVRSEFKKEIDGKKEQWKLWAPPAKDITALPGKPPQGFAQASKEAASNVLTEKVARMIRVGQHQDKMQLAREIIALVESSRTHPEEGFYRGRQFSGPQLVKGSKLAGQWGDRSFDSDQVHDVLDAHRLPAGPEPDPNISFDDPLPESAQSEVLASLEGANDDTYLGVITWMVSHGDNVPAVYRERARQIAAAMAQDEGYLNSWKNPDARRAELNREIEMLSGNKTASDGYRRDKTLALASEMGFDTSKIASDWDTGSGWRKDALYDEISVMAAQDRQFSDGNRRLRQALEFFFPFMGGPGTSLPKKS